MAYKDLNAGTFDLNTKNIDVSKLPVIIKDKVLMAPGTWNEETYSPEEIKKAFDNMNWNDKDSISLVADHASVALDEDNANAGLSVHDWFGFIRNARLDESGTISNVQGAIIGDLEIHDSQIAQKLVNAGAKFGISPRVYGAESELNPGVVTDFSFKHFAVVTSPAISKAYINLSKKDLERGEGQGVDGPKQGDGGASKCVCPKCGTSISHEKGKPCSEIKCPKCGATMGGKTSDMSEESQLPEEGKTSLKGGLENKESMTKEEPKKEEVKTEESSEKKAEDLSKIDKLTDQMSKLTSIVEKHVTKDMESEEEPAEEKAEEPEEPKEEEAKEEVKEEPAEEEAPAEESETVKDMAKKMKEMEAKLKDLENTPEKATITKDLSATNSNPMHQGYSEGEQQMSNFLKKNYA